ncbi:Anthranilate synthase, amidotransferase component @ Para-aminobenzoate synthase, amidotransferase component [invertebrate metagenome]|uniref:Anthranilate synthase, amidotransferase component @ Para-aminobenzoate synthase, amidotransferase component n=1 Tax=invertebrate metagenome TaxID=1711999 RepID=A0A484H6F0_9ZZZZ
MFLLIDNYDSFTYNLWHYLREQGAEVVVRRNDSVSVLDALAIASQGVIVSPGPCDPDRAGICLDLLSHVCVPTLGVCLGHQAIGQAFGGKVIRAPVPMHGKVSSIYHTGSSLFAGLSSPFQATRYHSLIVERSTLPACLEVTAATEDGLVMGLAHRTLPIFGVQFHPESVASAYGHALIANFLALTHR